MRQIFLLLVGIGMGYAGTAQELTPTFRFTAGVDNDLRQQFTNLLYREGCAVDTLSGVLLSLRVSPVQAGQIDGMKRLHTATFNLYVESRLSGSQRVLTSEIAQIQSTGPTPEQARQGAFRQLQNSSTRLNSLVGKLAADYRKAFSGPCHSLLADAAKLAANDQLLTALALTNAVPAEASCFHFAQNQRAKYYNQYQEAFCHSHLEEARSQLALEMPKAAIDELGKIDPESSCAGEARELLDQAAAQLKDQQSAKARFLRQVYQNQVQVEQARNQIISELVKE